MKKSGANMGYRIVYHTRVEDEDIPSLPETVRQRVRLAIIERIMICPDAYGKPLRKSLSGYRKLRICDWRIIYRIDCDTVKVFIIAHRLKVYDYVFQRLPA